MDQNGDWDPVRFKREAELRGHKIESINLGMCIDMPQCTRCGKQGWINLNGGCTPHPGYID